MALRLGSSPPSSPYLWSRGTPPVGVGQEYWSIDCSHQRSHSSLPPSRAEARQEKQKLLSPPSTIQPPKQGCYLEKWATVPAPSSRVEFQRFCPGKKNTLGTGSSKYFPKETDFIPLGKFKPKNALENNGD